MTSLVMAQRPTGTSSSGNSSGNIFGAPNATNPNDTTSSGFLTVFHGKPGKAALYSLLLPGAGQLYNKRWWKVPLVYGMEGYIVYNIIRSNRRFTEINDCYTDLVGDPQETCAISYLPEGRQPTNFSEAFELRTRIRRNKELNLLFLIGAHLFQSLEAFIDRHLIDFDVDDDLSYQPYMQGQNFDSQIKLWSIRIPLNQKRKLIAKEMLFAP